MSRWAHFLGFRVGSDGGYYQHWDDGILIFDTEDDFRRELRQDTIFAIIGFAIAAFIVVFGLVLIVEAI